MKLRLPHKFQAALLAAIASVSFTTLSTGTLGAAFFLANSAAAEDSATADEDEIPEFNIGYTDPDASPEESDKQQKIEVDQASIKTIEVGSNGGPGNNAGLLITESDDIDETVLDTVAGSGQQDTVSGTVDATPADDLGFTSNPYASDSDTSNGSGDFSLTDTAPAAAYVPEQSGIFAEEGDSAAGTGSGSSTNKTTTGAIGSIGGTGSGAIGGSVARPMALTASNMLSPVSSFSVGGTALGGDSGSLPESTMLGDAGADSNKTLHVYILTGQSNSEGAVKTAPASQAMLDRYSSDTLFWHTVLQGYSSKNPTVITSTAWDKVAPHKPYEDGNLCMGPEYGFSYMFNKLAADSTVTNGSGQRMDIGQLAVVKASLNGGGNTYWVGGSVTYNLMLDSIKAAITQAAADGYTSISIDGLLYLQGESNDASPDVANRYNTLLSDFTNDLNTWKADQSAAIQGMTVAFQNNSVLGEPSRNRYNTIESQIAMATKDGHVNTDDNGKGFIYANSDLGTGPDGLHYSGEAQITIGARYAYAFAVQEGYNVGAVRGSNKNASLDSDMAWWMEAKPSTTDVVKWDVSSVANTNTISNTLTVGGVLVEDPYQGQVNIAGGTLHVGPQGIELKEGSLSVSSLVATDAAQTWKIAGGRSLNLSNASNAIAHDISLAGTGTGTATVMVAGTTQGWNVSGDVSLKFASATSLTAAQAANLKLASLNGGDLSLTSLTLESGSSLAVGGAGVAGGLNVGTLALGGDATINMDFLKTSRYDTLSIGSGLSGSGTVTFNFNVGHTGRGGAFNVVTGWGDGTNFTATGLDGLVGASLANVNGNLVLTLPGSVGPVVVDYTKDWPEGTPETASITTNNVYDASALGTKSNVLVNSRTSTGDLYYFTVGNSSGTRAIGTEDAPVDLYSELNGVSATWVAAVGSNKSSTQITDLWGNASVKVTGTQTFGTTTYNAVNATNVHGDVYMELNDANATYTAINGTYSSNITGSNTIVIQSGTVSGDVVAGSVNGATAIGGGTYLQIEGGTFNGNVAAGNKAVGATINGGTHLLINGGTFNGYVYGGSAWLNGANLGTINGDIEVNVTDGTFAAGKLICAAGYGGTVNGNVTLTVSGGTFADNYEIRTGFYDTNAKVAAGFRTALVIQSVAEGDAFASTKATLKGCGSADGQDTVLTLSDVTTALQASMSGFTKLEVVEASEATLSRSRQSTLGGASTILIKEDSFLTLNGDQSGSWDLTGKTFTVEEGSTLNKRGEYWTNIGTLAGQGTYDVQGGGGSQVNSLSDFSGTVHVGNNTTLEMMNAGSANVTFSVDAGGTAKVASGNGIVGTLAGTGTVEMKNAVKTGNNATAFNFDPNWTGTVKVTASDGGTLYLSKLGQTGSTIEIAGVTGVNLAHSAGNKVTANIKLSGDLTLTDGFSKNTTFFEGNWSGSGAFNANMDPTQTFNFRGNMNEYTGTVTLNNAQTLQFGATDGSDVSLNMGIPDTSDTGKGIIHGAGSGSAKTAKVETYYLSDAVSRSTMTGNLSLTQKGSQTLTLYGQNTYTGATTVEKGSLKLDGSGTTGTGDVVLKHDTTLAIHKILLGDNAVIETKGQDATISGHSVVNANSIQGASSSSLATVSHANIAVAEGKTLQLANVNLVDTAITGQVDLLSSVNADSLTIQTDSIFKLAGEDMLHVSGTLALQANSTLDLARLFVTPVQNAPLRVSSSGSPQLLSSLAGSSSALSVDSNLGDAALPTLGAITPTDGGTYVLASANDISLGGNVNLLNIAEGYSGTLSTQGDTGAKQLILTLTADYDGLIWNNTDGNWSNATDADMNWHTADAPGTSVAFSSGKNVRFDSNANGHTVTLTDDISAGVVTVDKNVAVTVVHNSHSLNGTLAGYGTYALANTVSALPSGLSLGSDWHGVVQVTGATTVTTAANSIGTVIQNLTQGDSWVKLSGVQGYLGGDNTYTGNIILENSGNTSALAITSSVPNKTTVLSGDIKGAGDIERKIGNGNTLTFDGDLSGWTGGYFNGGKDGSFNAGWNVVNFTHGGEINADFINRAQSTSCYLTLVYQADTTVKGDIYANPPSGKSTVINVTANANTTFMGTVNANTLTVAQGKTATMATNAIITGITNNGTVAVTGGHSLQLNASANPSLGNVELDGSSLKLASMGGTRTYSVTSLKVSGDSHINHLEGGGSYYNGLLNITSLTSAEGQDAALSIGNAARHNAFFANIDGGSFNGTLTVMGEAVNGTRRTAVQLNDENVAAGAVVKFDVLDGKATNNVLGLGVGANNVNVLGITTVNAPSGTYIYSGKRTNTSGYNSNFDSVDTTYRTLTIGGAGEYDTSATVRGYLNLVMDGEGTQNFTGDLSAMTGAVTVTAGALTLDNSSSTKGNLESVEVTAGTLALDGMNVAGAGAITLNSGTLDLMSATTTGSLVMDGGTLKLRGENWLTSSTDNLAFTSGTLDLTGMTIQAGQNYTLASTTGGSVTLGDVNFILADPSLKAQYTLQQDGNNLVLTCARPSMDIVWDHNTDNHWDVATLNWHASGTSQPGTEHFAQNDNVIFEAGAGTAVLQQDTTVGTMTLQSSANVTVDTNGNSLGATTLTSNGGSLTKAGEGSMTIENAVALTGTAGTANKVKLSVTGGELHIKTTGTTIDGKSLVSGTAGEDGNTNAFTQLFKGEAIPVTGDGKLVLDGNIFATEQTGGVVTLASGISSLEVTGNVTINRWSAATYQLNDHSMEVGGNFWLKNHQNLNLAGGNLEVGGSLTLAHEGNTAAGGTDYRSAVTATDDSTVKLGDIKFYSGGNSVGLTDSTVTFTKDSGNVLSRIGNSASAAANTVTLTNDTLVAQENSWTMNAMSGDDNTTVTVSGATKLDIGADKSIIIGGATIGGSLDFGSSEGSLVLNDSTVAATGLNVMGGNVTFGGTTTLLADKSRTEYYPVDPATNGWLEEKADVWVVASGINEDTDFHYDQAAVFKHGNDTLTASVKNGDLVAAGPRVQASNVYYIGETGTEYQNLDSAYQNAAAFDVGAGKTFIATGNNLNAKELILESGSTWMINSATGFNLRQLQTLTLNGDAMVQANGNAALIGSNYSPTTLNMGGNTLTVQGSGHLAMHNTTAADAGTIAVKGGVLQVGHDGRQVSTNLKDVTLNFSEQGKLWLAANSTITVEGLEGEGSIDHEGGAKGTIVIESNLREEYSFTGTISNDKNLEMASASTGTQNLNLTSTTTLGTVNVNGGTLNLSCTGILTTGTVTVGDAGTLGLANTINTFNGSLTVDGTLKLSEYGSDAVTVTSLTFGSGATLDLTDLTGITGQETAPIILVKGGSIDAGNLGSVVVDFAPSIAKEYRLSVSGTDLVLTFAGAARDLIWDGGTDLWDVDTTAHWHTADEEPGASRFVANDNATFAQGVSTAKLATDITAGSVVVQSGAEVTLNSAGGTSLSAVSMNVNGALTSNVNLVVESGIAIAAGCSLTTNAELHASSISVAADSALTAAGSASYTLDAVLSGAGSYVKDGTGTVTLSADNSGFTGVFTINEGTVRVGNNKALGTNNAIRLSGGTLDVNGSEGTNTSHTVEFAGGTLTNSGAGKGFNKRQFVNSATITADSEINAANEMGFTASDYAAITVTFSEGTTLNKTGAATFWVSNATVSGNGAFKVSEGKLQFQQNGTYASNFEMAGGEVAGAITMEGAVTVDTTADSKFSATINTNGNALTFDGAAGLAETGVISGNGSLTKTGTGTLTLTGTNTYTGSTAVNGGTLLVGGASSLTYTSGVTVNSGATLQFDTALGANARSSSITVAGSSGSLPGGTLTFGGVDDNALNVTGTLSLGSGSVLDLSNLALGEDTGRVKLVTAGTLNISEGVESLSISGYGGYDLTLTQEGNELWLDYENKIKTLIWDNSKRDNVWLAEEGEVSKETPGTEPNWHRPNAVYEHIGFRDYDRATFNGNATPTLGSNVVAGRVSIAADKTVTVNTETYDFSVDGNIEGHDANMTLSGGTQDTMSKATVEGNVNLRNLTLDTVDATLKGETEIAQTLSVTDGAKLTAKGLLHTGALAVTGSASAAAFDGTAIAATTVVSDGAALSVNADAALGALTLNSGTVTNNATLTLSNTQNMVVSGNSRLTGTGTTTTTGILINDDSTLTVDGGQTVSITTPNGVIGGSGEGSTLTLGNATLTGTSSWTLADTVDTVNLTSTTGSETVFDTNAHSVTVNAGMSGTGNLTKVGHGTLTLNGSNSFSGDTTVSAGVLKVNNANGLSRSANVSVENGATLWFNSDTTASLSGTTSIADGATLHLGSENALTTTGSLTLSADSTLNLYGMPITSAKTEYVLATGSSITLADGFDMNNVIVEYGTHPAVGTPPKIEVKNIEGGQQALVLTYDIIDSNSRYWNGGTADWTASGTWHDVTTKDPTTFAEFDDVFFAPTEYSNPSAASVQANVTKNTHVHEMNIVAREGEGAAKNTVNVVVNNGQTLTVDFLEADVNTALIKQGAGTAIVGIDDPHFGADVSVTAGTLTTQFLDLAGNGMVVDGVLNRTGGTLNLEVGRAETPTNVEFTQSVSGVKNFTVNEGSNATFTGQVTVPNGQDIYMDVASDASVTFAHDVSLASNSWVIQGDGTVNFDGPTVISEVSGHFNQLNGNAKVNFNSTLSTAAAEIDIRLDPGTNLYIKELDMVNSNQDTLYFTFKNTYGTQVDRDSVQIDKMVVDGSRGIGTNTSSLPGLKDYQAGGDINIKQLANAGEDTSNDIARLCNYVGNLNGVTPGGWGIAQVFNIGEATQEGAAFEGIIRLQDSRNQESWAGSADYHKKTVLVLNDEYVASEAVIELKNYSNYSDFAIGINTANAKVTAIEDYNGHAMQNGNYAKVFSGAMDTANTAVPQSDDTLRTLELIGKTGDTADTVHSTSAGVDRNLNIVKDGAGTQVFSGDSSNFDGSVNAKDGLLKFLNTASLTVQDLTLAENGSATDGTLAVRSDAAGTNVGMAEVHGTLKANSGSKLASNLTLAADSVLDVRSTLEKHEGQYADKTDYVGGLDMLGNSLTLQSGAYLSDADRSALLSMQWGERYELAYGLSSLTLGDSPSTTEAIVFHPENYKENNIEASQFFQNLQEEDYYICYSGAGLDGPGGNVGTLYIFKAPEPTTSTLSLLALAALAARRRRK